MKAPAFALITEGEFRRLNSKLQRNLCDEAETFWWQNESLFGFAPMEHGTNTSQRWAYVRAIKEGYWSHVTGPARPSAPVFVGMISAAECNAFLRSLPPVPLYGEGGR